MLKRPFCGMAVCFLLGILCAAYGGGSSFAAVSAAGLLWIVSLAAVFRKKKHVRELCTRITLCALMLLLGFCQYQSAQLKRQNYLPKISSGMPLTVQGRVAGKQLKNNQYIYELTDCFVKEQKGTHLYHFSMQEPVSCNGILAYSDSDLVSIGEIVILNGTAELWKTAVNQGNFDAQAFYLARKTDFALKNVTLLERHGRKSAWREGLFALKLRLKEVYGAAMEPLACGVMTTMVTGDKTLLDEETKRLYQTAGLSHIMAISGLHISIIGMTLYRFLRNRGCTFGTAGMIAGICLYGYGTMAGMGTSIERSAGMFGLLLLAQAAGRSYDSLNALGLMGLILLWRNPYLLWDAGFQFSFAAILGIVWLGGCISFADASHRKQKEMLFASTAVQFATLPLVTWYYYEIPLYALPVNLLVLPLMGVILSCGVAGGALGLVWLRGASFVLCFSEKLLALVRWLCAGAAALPQSMVIVGRPKLWQVFCYYAGLVGVTFLIYRQKTAGIAPARQVRRLLCVSAALLFVLLFRPPKTFELSFLDVGQGDGIYLHSESGCDMFVDGGSTSEKQGGTYRMLPFLKYKGVKSIDVWFVSHTDEDHISGLRELLEAGYAIDTLVFAETTLQDEAYEVLAKLAEKNKTELLYVKAGDTLYLGDARISMLFPAGTNDESLALAEDKNANSLVFSYEENGFCGLFTGDTGAEQERAILKEREQLAADGKTENGRIGVDVYKAAHHGSKYSNSSELLERISPTISVISCAEKNRYGHPHAEAVARMKESGSEVFCTMDAGQITTKIREGKLLVEQFVERK